MIVSIEEYRSKKRIAVAQKGIVEGTINDMMIDARAKHYPTTINVKTINEELQRGGFAIPMNIIENTLFDILGLDC